MSPPRQIRHVHARPFDLGLVVRATLSGDDDGRVVQCLHNGEPADWQAPDADAVIFALPPGDPAGSVELRLVEAAGAAAADDGMPPGGRIELLLAPCGPAGQRVALWLSRPGEELPEPTAVVEPCPGGRGAGGFGMHMADGGFGLGIVQAPGLGWTFGLGGFGLDTAAVRWRSDPLSGGKWIVTAAVLDAGGAAGPTWESRVRLAGQPRPAGRLTLAHHDILTDTLHLTWTASEDLP